MTGPFCFAASVYVPKCTKPRGKKESARGTIGREKRASRPLEAPANPIVAALSIVQLVLAFFKYYW